MLLKCKEFLCRLSYKTSAEGELQRKNKSILYERAFKMLENDMYEKWFNSSTFPTNGNWKSIVKNQVRDLESRLWLKFCSGHPNMHVAQACSENISPSKFWSLADFYPDLVSRLHTQVRLMGNLCLNGGIPWLFKTEGCLCFISNENTETVYHHFIECSPFI